MASSGETVSTTTTNHMSFTTDHFTRMEVGNIRANFDDFADKFMTKHQTGTQAALQFFRWSPQLPGLLDHIVRVSNEVQIRAANSAGKNLDQNLPRPGNGSGEFLDNKLPVPQDGSTHHFRSPTTIIRSQFSPSALQ
jgi:hypothetical protein